MTYKILIEEDSFVPKWFGYANEIAPPLCGAIPASTDYIKKHIKPNHLVVAYVDSTETKKDNKDSENLMDDKKSETLVDDKNSETLVDDKNSENLVDEKNSKNLVADKNSENCMDYKNSENCEDNKNSENCVDEKNSENCADEKNSENCVEKKYSENWILAQLIKIDENKCLVYDIDVAANQFYEVDIEDIIPLPICKADPESNPEAFFRLGSIVLAPAEYSSCFYPALVIALPKTIDDTYSLKFKYPGEALMFGDVVHVPQSYVVQHKKLSQNIGRCT